MLQHCSLDILTPMSICLYLDFISANVLLFLQSTIFISVFKYVSMENTFIYALLDPRNNFRIYIGKSDNPQQRLKQHLTMLQPKTIKNDWVKKLLSLNLTPELIIIDEVPRIGWDFWEKFYIEQFRCWGFTLMNGTDGGDGGNTFIKLSEDKKTIFRERARIHAIKIFTGKKLSEAHRLKITQSQTGRTNSPESNIKRSNTLRGRVSPNKGNILTTESRQKLAEGHKKIICVLDKELNIVFSAKGYNQLAELLKANKNHISNCRLYKKYSP